MQISEILNPGHVMCGVTTNSKKGALEELSKLIAKDDSSLTYTDIFDCLIARERLGSTGLGHGIAIPHGRFKHIKKPVAAFLQLKNGIDYDAIDQKHVDLIFALLVPEESTDEHLKILSQLAELFSDDTLLNKLRRALSAEKVYKLLTNFNE